MIGRQDYIDVWGTDNVFEYPRAEWMSEYSAPPEVYLDVDFIPTDMSLFFTSYLEGGRFHLYDRINLRVADDEYMRLVIVGANPIRCCSVSKATAAAWFCSAPVRAPWSW